jgi:RNA polymerase sigma-70 factor, ECF subfamily
MDSAELFEAIVRDFYEPLFRFALSLARTESDAQDLTQHTFYIWARKGHQPRDTSKVKMWLFTTLHREFLMKRRKHTRFQHYELDEVAAELPVFAPNIANQLDSSHALTAVGKLDEIYRPAIILFYLECCSYKEIAAILDVPLGTVKSRLARAIQELRQMLLADNTSAPPRNCPAKEIAAAGPPGQGNAPARASARSTRPSLNKTRRRSRGGAPLGFTGVPGVGLKFYPAAGTAGPVVTHRRVAQRRNQRRVGSTLETPVPFRPQRPELTKNENKH